MSSVYSEEELKHIDLQNYNKYLKRTGDTRYVCLLCGAEVDLSESFSNGGHNMVCISCTNKYSKRAGSKIKWLEENVWTPKLLGV